MSYEDYDEKDGASKEIHAMRSMAWERAKGELMAMEHTYYGEQAKYDKLTQAIELFVSTVEDEGLHE